jgi:hypothetical protein
MKVIWMRMFDNVRFEYHSKGWSQFDTFEILIRSLIKFIKQIQNILPL